MSYYWFDRKEILQSKKKKRYSKEKAAEYYSQKRKQWKKSQRIGTKTCQKEKNQD